MDPITLIIAAVTLAVGLVIGRMMMSGKANDNKAEADKVLSEATAKAERILSEAQLKGDALLKEREIKAEGIRKEKEIQAKERFLQLKGEHEVEIVNRTRDLVDKENQFKSREGSLKQKEDELQRAKAEAEKAQAAAERKVLDLEKAEEKLDNQRYKLEERQEEVEKVIQAQNQRLEQVAGLTQAEALAQLTQNLTDEARSRALHDIKDIVEEAKATAAKESKKVVIETIQRTATEAAVENAISVFQIKNDDVKGQVIGREGRNIRALEAATGVEFIVDDTPEAIILSCFDPMRREIARLSLHRLVTDGRIHPARIEEVVDKVKKQVEQEVLEVGQRTVMDLGIHGLPSELTRLIGKMKYRSSYGQNLLQHSREVANLCATMAAEMGLSPKLAKRAGLLHDIGKVPDDNPEVPHAILGMQICERLKEHPIVVNAVGAHHDEIEMTDPISAIVQACDAISGARPGARREIVETYIQRLKDLEALGNSYPGVEKTFAIQAGRELRILVESEKVTDEQAELLSVDISQRIQSEMQYPGQIKVTVIREKRSVAYAK